MEIENYNLRETYYSQIYTMKPAWWMKWGIATVFIILAIIITLAYFIRYPDTVVSDLRLTTNKPSITLPITTTAQVHELFVHDGEIVDKGTTLLVLDNNGNYKDILALEEQLQQLELEKSQLLRFFENTLTQDLKLGSILENHWIQFSTALLEYYKIQKLDSYNLQKSALRKELDRQIALRNKYVQLITTDAKEQELLNNKLRTDSTLYQKGVISRMQYNDGKQNFYSTSKQLQQNQLSLRRINIEITRLRNAIKNYSGEETASILTHTVGIRESLAKLKSAIQTWKDTYVVEAPMGGKVNYLQELAIGKFYDGNIMVITPVEEEYYASLKIPFAGSGKVAKDQEVVIKLNDYPYREFGILRGTISEIATVADETYYLAKVAITKNNLSSYGKEVSLKENMSGIGEIITEDRNVLSRVFEKVTYAFHQ